MVNCRELWLNPQDANPYIQRNAYQRQEATYTQLQNNSSIKLFFFCGGVGMFCFVSFEKRFKLWILLLPPPSAEIVLIV